jgi:dihydrofolate reductase
VSLRRIRYAVATSLDGYIAGPNGEADWIIMDPDIDFGAIFNEFDTFLMGRRTFALMPQGGSSFDSGMKTFVFSRTLRPSDYPDVTIVSERPAETSGCSAEASCSAALPTPAWSTRSSSP